MFIQKLFRRKTESDRFSEQLNNLKALLTLSEAAHKHMKYVNDYYREHGTTLGCRGVTDEAAKILDSQIEKGNFSDGRPYSDYVLMNAYYDIQRLKREIAELEKRINN